VVRGSVQVVLTMLSCVAVACGASRRSVGSGGSGNEGGKLTSGGSGATGGASAPGGAGGSRAGSDTGPAGEAGEGTSASGGAGGTMADPPNGVSLDGSPIYTRVQRLTNTQWEHAVTDILGFDSPKNLSQAFVPPVSGTTDFTNNERLLYVDVQSVIDFETAAEAAAALATGSDEALAALYSGTDVSDFVQTLGRRAFRRPLTPEELERYQGMFELGETLYGAGFAHGAALVIRAFLESPHFLYRTELGPARDPLNGYEVASKLSFWLRDTTPSDALLDEAAAGALDTADGVEAAARQMLEETTATGVMRDFHGQLYQLGRLANGEKPGVDEYGEDMKLELTEASYRFFDDVLEKNRGLSDILTSTTGFVGPGLAPLYGSDPVASGLEERELGAARGGYFSQVPFLLLWGHGVDSAPIERGLAISQSVLCAKLGPPPPDTPGPGALPAQSPDQTTREWITAVTSRPECAGCHAAYIDPLGFAFENFDGMGRERRTDNGKPVDTKASYPFAEGTQSYANAQELMQILADSTQAHTCYAKKVSSFALQRDIVEGDRPLLAALAKVSKADSLKEMIVSLARDPAFRARPEVTP